MHVKDDCPIETPKLSVHIWLCVSGREMEGVGDVR
jgi:hypothetical protein